MESDSLQAQLGSVAAEWHALCGRLLDVMAELAASGEWAEVGIGSLGQWASVELGLQSGTTRHLLSTAKAVATLPNVRAALAEGRLSYDKARMIGRVASAESEERWLEVALLASASQLERIVGAYRRASTDRTPFRSREHHDQRSCTWDDPEPDQPDGLVRLVAWLQPEDAAIVRAAIEAEVEREWRGRSKADQEAGKADPLVARRADALVAVAERSLEAGDLPLVGGRRPEVIVHVDAELLAHATDVGICQVEGGPTIPVETARRLCCDAVIRPLIRLADGRVLDFGRSRRTPTRRQRRSLQVRDGGCVFPGCRAQDFVDAHHLWHWIKGGPTDMANLALLCRRHHRLLHEGGYRMWRDADGRLRCFTDSGYEIGPPDRPPITAHRRKRYGPRLPRAEGGGGPFDLGLTVDLLLQRHPPPEAA